MLESILALAKELILIKSIPENPQGLQQVLDTATSNLKEFTIEQFEHNGSRSVLVYPSKKRPEKFRVLLNAHLDVVPGKDHLYKPTIKNNKLYGVGALDMKANAASLIFVFKEIASKINYPIGLQIVTDEELGGFNGTKHQIDQGVTSDFVLTSEPTNLNIVHKAKGILWLKIASKGKTAHGAYPWKGENAIWKMNEFLNALKETYPFVTEESWVSTINLSKIETQNNSFNKIPDDCTISLDIRFIPEDEQKILDSIRRLLPSGFILEKLFQEPSMYVDKNNPYILHLKNTTQQLTNKETLLYGAQGSSDARHFTQAGSSGIEFGPIGGDIGTDDEWVDIQSLETYFKILVTFLTSLR